MIVPGDTASCPTAVVDPDSAICRFEFVAFEVSCTFPLEVPLVCGVNVTLKVKFCPGVNVCGRLSPLTRNAPDDTAACVMLTFAVPLFLTVGYCVTLVARGTEPNAKLVGFAVNCPAAVLPPIPERAKLAFRVPFQCFLYIAVLAVTSMLPETVPVADGANVEVNFTL